MADAAAALRALAKHYGVQRAWRAADGRRCVVADDSLIAVLAAMRVPVTRLDDAPEALRVAREELVDRALDPVVVLWDGAQLRVALRLPVSEATADFTLVLRREDGTTEEYVRRQCRMGAPRREGITHVVTIVEPPNPRVPFGTHTLTLVRRGAEDVHATVIAAPAQLRDRPPGEQRRWGLFAPLYALHARDHAVGDLGALDRLSDWAAHHAADAIATLPLLAAFNGAGREPFVASPYSPVSRRYWNEAYIDVEAVPERGAASSGGDLDDRLSAGRHVDLGATAWYRREALLRAFANLSTLPARRDAFQRWRRTHPDVDRYARFRAAVEAHGAGVDVDRAPVEDRIVDHHAYVQWIADEQLRALADRLADRRQVLYLDLPLGVHSDGYDVWARPDLYVAGTRIGAPPDDYNTNGQDWGAPPLDPVASRASGHVEFRAAVTTHLGIAKLLRVDHVMGLHRLWWIPQGASPADGAYVQYPAEELYALLCLEADRAGALVVGENLGTVPHETNRSLQAHRMLGMYIAPFELRDDGLAPPGRRTLAALNTHDLPTFARWWHDLEPHRRGVLLDSLRDAGVLDSDEGQVLQPADVLGALLTFLGTSRAEMVLVALEDLWLEMEQQNDPSAGAHQRSNFTQRAARSLEELEADDAVHEVLGRLDAARRRGLVGV
jgi:4-alpha-glucanotransferase